MPIRLRSLCVSLCAFVTGLFAPIASAQFTTPNIQIRSLGVEYTVASPLP